ncbi:MAG TPA: methyltransferase [Chitinophagaceae bacterium]|nr:methyltransferase [Chitinophagaceae bacterium]
MENQTPAPIRAFQILGGMMNSFILSALIKNDVLETLNSGINSTEQIAAKCKLNKNVLARTLRYASLIGLVTITENKYSVAEAGRFFLKNTPGSLYGSANFISAPPWRDSWLNFEHCLKTGSPAFEHVFGQPFFQFLDTNQEYGKPFNHYMTTLTTMVAPVVAEAYDFSAFDTICDVGGGQGLLLKAIMEKFHHSKGVLFDMGSAVKEHVLKDLSDRVDIVSGNFFDSIPSADCMVLKTIIHDWNDENAIRILTNCRKNLKTGGKILLVEQVVEEPYTLMSLFYDLHMQVMLGGAERTVQEFKILFESAGLKLNRIVSTKSPMKIIEASC